MKQSTILISQDPDNNMYTPLSSILTLFGHSVLALPPINTPLNVIPEIVQQCDVGILLLPSHVHSHMVMAYMKGLGKQVYVIELGKDSKWSKVYDYSLFDQLIDNKEDIIKLFTIDNV
jgi:hypothetical protein